jgi:kinetochore protein Mis13/DSN1
MVWCAKRATDAALAPALSSQSKGKGKEKAHGSAAGGVRTEEGDKMVRDIMDEFMGNLSRGLIDTNVFGSQVSALRP